MNKDQEQYPDGKLNLDDGGKLSVSIGEEKGRVVIEFAQSVKWIAVTPDEAVDIAGILIKYARQCGSTKPLEVIIG